ncbi:MAG: hypothetical protein JSS02_04000 [Planctomycetes bacterium]|nr:hypothetical protein [Planctomycetota bacterium]
MVRGFRLTLVRLLMLVGCALGISTVASAQDDTEPGEPAEVIETRTIDPSQTPLAVDPKTADELFEATHLMVDLGRLDLAEIYFGRLQGAGLDDATLIALRDKYGAEAFLKLARIEKLNPGAQKLLDACNAAAIRQASDPERLKSLLTDLGTEGELHAKAEAELVSLGAQIIPLLLVSLNDPGYADKYDAIEEAILLMRERAIPPLVAALAAPQDKLDFRGRVISILGLLEAKPAIPFLISPAQSATEAPDVKQAARAALGRILNVSPETVDRIVTEGAVTRLLETVRQHFRQQHPWSVDAAGKVTLWLWSNKLGTVSARLLSPAEASEIEGLRLAREALALAPALRSTQVLYLASALAHDIRRTGFDRPLPTGPGTAHDAALTAGADVTLDVISEAVQAERTAVVVEALRIFSQVGTLAQLQLGSGQKSVVVAALDNPDPRVQFAAAVAILQVDPTAPFRGAARVVEVLKRALASDGRAHAIVGEVSVDRGAMIGGILRELGYEPLVYNSGREAFAAAASRNDVELVILHPNITRWALSETLANFRADSRTAGVPIVIHGPADLTRRMERKSLNYRLVSFSAASESSSDFDRQLTPLLRKVKAVSMTAQERRAQRVAAAAWLAHIARGRRTKIFDIRGVEPELAAVLQDEELARNSLDCLGEIASPTSQQRLAGLALDIEAPVDLRIQASEKLAFHIQRFGLMLKKNDIDSLHKLWQAPNEPAALRTAVGTVIGSLKPDNTLAGKRLQQQSQKPR